MENQASSSQVWFLMGQKSWFSRFQLIICDTSNLTIAFPGHFSVNLRDLPRCPAQPSRRVRFVHCGGAMGSAASVPEEAKKMKEKELEAPDRTSRHQLEGYHWGVEMARTSHRMIMMGSQGAW